MYEMPQKDMLATGVSFMFANFLCLLILHDKHQHLKALYKSS